MTLHQQRYYIITDEQIRKIELMLYEKNLPEIGLYVLKNFRSSPVPSNQKGQRCVHCEIRDKVWCACPHTIPTLSEQEIRENVLNDFLKRITELDQSGICPKGYQHDCCRDDCTTCLSEIVIADLSSKQGEQK
jgi:hypothetical protein